MPIVTDGNLHEFRDWKFRFRPASIMPSRLLVMLHGWTGDETSMWVFARKLPLHMAVMAPRGLYYAPDGGYTWRKIKPGTLSLPTLDDLHVSAEAIMGFVDDWSPVAGVNASQMDLIGFSQGAALGYTLALLFPKRIRVLAIFSGFLPNGAEDLIATRILEGKTIYIAHGRKDMIVPVEKARMSVKLLEESGAWVKYCESDGGHKVSLDCFSDIAYLFQ